MVDAWLWMNRHMITGCKQWTTLPLIQGAKCLKRKKNKNWLHRMFYNRNIFCRANLFRNLNMFCFGTFMQLQTFMPYNCNACCLQCSIAWPMGIDLCIFNVGNNQYYINDTELQQFEFSLYIFSFFWPACVKIHQPNPFDDAQYEMAVQH